jgi:hypothetical protein
MPYLRENLGKIILLMRHQGEYAKVFPFHYKDIYAIDFSADSEYENKFEELVYKIYNVPFYEMVELGPIPDLKPGGHKGSFESVSIDKKLIPNLRKITDIDKNLFLSKSYNQICVRFKQLFEQTKQRNIGFDYTYEEVTNRKTIIYAYIDGYKKTGIKMWFGNAMGFSEGIYFEYGMNLNESNDSSFNEIINSEIVNNELKLKRMMNIYGKDDAESIDDIVEDIWLYHIKHYIKR